MVVVSKHLVFSSFSILHLLLPQIPHVNYLSVSTITKGRAYQEIRAFQEVTVYWNLLRPVWYLISSFSVINFRWKHGILWTLPEIAKYYSKFLELTGDHCRILELMEGHSVLLPWVELKFRILWLHTVWFPAHTHYTVYKRLKIFQVKVYVTQLQIVQILQYS